MENKETIKKAIYDYLIENNMSVAELAAKIKVSRGSIYNWLNGKEIVKTNYEKLYREIKEYIDKALYC